MKTAVSVPDKLFKEAERLARRQRKSRSRLYADAIAEYLSRHDPQQVTRRINEVLAKIDEPVDLLVREAGDRILRNTVFAATPSLTPR